MASSNSSATSSPAPSLPPSRATSFQTPRSPGSLVVNAFLRVGDRLKKVRINLGEQTLGSLLAMFKERFPDECKDLATDQQGEETYLYLLQPTTKSEDPLIDPKQILANSIIELRAPKIGTAKKSGRAAEERSSIAYSGIQRGATVIVMVGLPARGKTDMSRKIANYLNWLGVPTKVFHVGDYRRKRIGTGLDSEFFSPFNIEAMKARLHTAIAALDDMVEYLSSEGRCAIYDGSNLTRERRKLIFMRCRQEGYNVVYIESVVHDTDLIEQNMREDILSPDYKTADKETALRDYKERIDNFEKIYQPLASPSTPPASMSSTSAPSSNASSQNDVLAAEEAKYSYIKVYDLGRKVEVNNISTYLDCRVVFYLMNLHTVPRPIWLSLSAECLPEHTHTNPERSVSILTPDGDHYAHQLAEWLAEKEKTVNFDDVGVWSSAQKSAIQTLQFIPRSKVRFRQLDDIDLGDFDGMPLSAIQADYPDDFKAMQTEPLNYRYPRGESYEDVIQRLEPIIFEIERTRNPVIIVAHKATLQCVYAYLMFRLPEDAPLIEIPQKYSSRAPSASLRVFRETVDASSATSTSAPRTVVIIQQERPEIVQRTHQKSTCAHTVIVKNGNTRTLP